MNTEPTPKCPQCGAPLPPDAPDGLCPACVMALNLKTETVFTNESPAAQSPLPPEQIAPHFPQLEILEFLGRGGMGVVYKARQKTLNRFVALKLLAPERVGDARFAERFTREAQALAALNHPNIVTIHDFGQAGGFYFLLMEFVDGVNLRQLLRARKFTPEEALAIVPPLCDALQFAHEHGIVHRDIKPENLLLDKSGRVKIADFGIAKMLGAGSGSSPGKSVAPESGTQSAVGTRGYSAPEQQTTPQRVDNRADIYSLGVVFYEMLTGELPGQRIEPPSKKVQIDVRLDAVVLRALEKTPELRWQTAADLRTQVNTIVATPPPPPVGAPPEFEKNDPKTKTDLIGPPRFSLKAILGAVWLPLCFIFTTLHTLTPGGANGFGAPGLEGNGMGELLLFGFIAAIGTTGLGLLAISDIRRSRGQITGLPLALTDALFVPLLALNGLIFLLCDFIAIAVHGEPDLSNRNRAILLAATLVLSLLADFLIARAAWRAAKQPSQDSSIPPGSQSQTIASESQKPEARVQEPQVEPQFSRTAIWGACWSPFFFIAVVLLFLAIPIPAGGPPPSRKLLGVFLAIIGFTAPFGVTILGYIAVTQITRSAGKLYGLWLAVFDGLLYPLLALDGLIAWVWPEIIKMLLGHSFNTTRYLEIYQPDSAPRLVSEWSFFPIVLTICIVDFFIIRGVWRTMSKASPGLSISPAAPTQNRPANTSLAHGGLIFAGLSSVLSAVTLYFWPDSPAIFVLLILVLAFFGIALGIWSRSTGAGKMAIAVSCINAVIWLMVAVIMNHRAISSSASAEVYCRVFEADAGLVDQLVPPQTRQRGDEREKGLIYVGSPPNAVSQMAQINTRILRSLLTNVPPDTGLLLDHRREVFLWPKMPDGESYASSNSVGGIGGFVGFRRYQGALQLRVQYYISHMIPAWNSVNAEIFYEGDAPPPGSARAFLVPFENKDHASKYLVIVFEVGRETNAAPSAPGHLQAFGSVMEREFTNVAMIDFDSGKVRTEWPEPLNQRNYNNIIENVLAAFDWMERQGLDFAYLESDGTFCVGMKVKELSPSDWSNLSASQLATNFAMPGSGFMQTRLDNNSNSPAFYGFQTREGSMGILQIIDFTENPRGVKICYKLVQNQMVPRQIQTSFSSETNQISQPLSSTDASIDWNLTARELDELPPMLVLRPTRFAHAGGEVMTASQKRLARNRSLNWVLSVAYDFDPARMIFSSDLPEGNFDLILTLTNQPREALQKEIKNQLGVVAQRETRGGREVLAVKKLGSEQNQ